MKNERHLNYVKKRIINFIHCIEQEPRASQYEAIKYIIYKISI